MSQDIIREVSFFLHSTIMGIVITFVYDWFLILRKLIKHNSLWISLEDIIFWLACGIGVFYMLYRENNGVLRWFTVIGAVIGMAVYKLLIGSKFVHIMSTCIYKIMWLIFKILQVIVKPLKWLLSKLKKLAALIKRKLRKLRNFIKNKLTVCIKMFKMVLCKQ